MENGHLRQTLVLHSEKLAEIETSLVDLIKSLRPLADMAESIKGIETEIKLLRQDLIGAAVGTDRVPQTALDAVAKAHMTIHKALCLVIVALTAWFTGLKYWAPNIFGGH